MSIYSKFFAIDGKTAVITGAGSGIGQAVALAFVEAGATVVAADLNEDGLEETVSAAANRAGIRAVVADVSSPDSIRELADQADKLFGRVDFLVNNAAISRRHPAEAFPEEDWDRILAVNLKGTFLCAQEFGRRMLAQGEGRIVNLTSIGGVGGYPGSSAYMSSKGGVVQLTKSLAIEWSSRGVNVNAIAPGITRTRLLEKLAEENPAQVEWFLERLAIREMIDPQYIAAAAMYLCSPAARYVTGHVLAVDAGFLAF